AALGGRAMHTHLPNPLAIADRLARLLQRDTRPEAPDGRPARRYRHPPPGRILPRPPGGRPARRAVTGGSRVQSAVARAWGFTIPAISPPSTMNSEPVQ